MLSMVLDKISLALHNRRILSIPLFLVHYRRHLNAMLSTSRDQTVPRNQMPITLFISAWLAGDDDMFAVIFDRLSRKAIRGMVSIGVVRVFSIECRARCCGVVSIDVS